jgi:Ca-activated chloride channel family protein
MQWRDPNFLWLLMAVAALAVALVVLFRRRAARLRLFAEEPLVARLAPDLDTRRRAGRIAIRLVALLVLAVTLAGPKWGFEWREVRREGIDLMVALDTSRSMLATDVKPNRLERAKLAIQDMLELLDGDRIGLVAFAGTAFLECPLTVDYAAFEASLRATGVGIIPRGGTALERAIDASLAAFDAGEGKHQALILITDGEDHEGEPEKAAERAAERGVKVFTVGIGTTEGELVPASGGAGGFLKDRKGQVVKSRLNESTLEQIAIKTDGAYVRGGGATLGLDEVFRDHIAKMERREVASSLERLYEERFQIPLALALVLLFVEFWIGDRKPAVGTRRRWLRLPRPRLPRRRRSRSAAPARGAGEVNAFVLLLAFSPALLGWLDPRGDRAAEGNRLYDQGNYEEAASKYGDGLVDAPGSPLLQFNLGTALYKQGKYEEAIGPLSKVAASADAAWTAPASYNLGNALYRLAAGAEESDPQAAIGHYEQALAAFKRAMGAAPQDPDPKYNHEFVARKLAELKKRLEEEKQQQEQEQQEQQEQQPQEQGQEEQQQQEQEEQQEQQGQEEQQQQQEQQGEDQQQEQAGEQPQEERPEQQQAEQQPAPGEEEQPSEEEPPGEAQAAGGQPAGEPSEEASPDEQAAQAVLDMAAEEELRPEDLQRRTGVAGVGEPLQDW